MAESALIAGLARAPAALSPWSNLDGAIARSHVVLARMRDARLHRPRRRNATARRAPAPRAPVSQRRRRTARLRQGLPAAAVPRRVRRRSPARLARRHHLRRGAPGRRRGRGRARPRPPAARPASRRRWWRSIRTPATCWRWSAAATISASAFNRASRSRRQPGSAFKPFVFAAALERGLSPVSTLTGLDRHPAAGPRRMDAAQRPRRRARRAHAAGGADRVEQPRGDAAAAAARHQAGSRRRVAGRTARSARRAVAGARHRPGHAAGADHRVCDVPQRRAGGAAARHHPRPRRRRRHRAAAGRGDRARAVARGRLSRWCRCWATSSIAAPGRRRAVSASGSRPAARPARPTTSRTRGSSASHRRSSPAYGWASISRRPIGARRLRRRATPCRSGRSSCSARRAIRPPGTFERPAGLQEETLCAHHLPEAGGRLSALHRVLQGRRRGARTGCARCIAARSGNACPAVLRDVLSEAGRRVRAIFR